MGEGPNSGTADLSLITFAIGGAEYALVGGDVAEVLRMVAITPIPDAPKWLAGVVNLRGQIIPIVDLRIRLGAPEAPIELSTPIIVASTHGRVVGLIADSMIGMFTASRDDLHVHDGSGAFSTGVVELDGRLVVVIDLAGVCLGLDAFGTAIQ